MENALPKIKIIKEMRCCWVARVKGNNNGYIIKIMTEGSVNRKGPQRRPRTNNGRYK